MGNRLDGKVALITGSTSGIGRATARLFAAEGAKVVVNGRHKDRCEKVVAEITSEGGQARFYCADVGNSQSVRDLVRFAADSWGQIDVLMNNAFFNARGTAVELEEAGWDRSMAVMLKASYIACSETIPHMIHHGGGSIINIASVHGERGAPRRHVYGAAKAGLINMAKQIAVDFGPMASGPTPYARGES